MQVLVLSNAFDREKDAFQGGNLYRAKYQFQTVNCSPGGAVQGGPQVLAGCPTSIHLPPSTSPIGGEVGRGSRHISLSIDLSQSVREHNTTLDELQSRSVEHL